MLSGALRQTLASVSSMTSSHLGAQEYTEIQANGPQQAKIRRLAVDVMRSGPHRQYFVNLVESGLAYGLAADDVITDLDEYIGSVSITLSVYSRLVGR